MIKLIFNIISFIISFDNVLCLSNKNDDKLLLSPVELIDLVREEQQKNQLPSVTDNDFTTDESYEQEETKTQSDSEQDLSEDLKILRNRKVWSRWSKWSECSVTCGGGSIARHRMCVAGRCAPGELEEQRRPCSRAPCRVPEFNITEEMRELE